VGQFRRDGVTPYITHSEAVAKSLEGEDPNVIAAAWLHDVLEDTTATPDVLRDVGVSEKVIRSVTILTRKEGQGYEEYLGWVRLNDIACKVKIADMRHNLSDSPTDKQVEKYTRALKFLEASSLGLLEGSGFTVKDGEGKPLTFATKTETGRPRP
jgi:(p)ppGpp synthase/HD superfamily hydrolase